MNALQRALVDALRESPDLPDHGQRGWQAQLSRRSGVSEQVISNVFKRDAYLPEDRHRAALATALGIPQSRLNAAGAEIKGLRAHGSVLRTIDQLDAESNLVSAVIYTPGGAGARPR